MPEPTTPPEPVATTVAAPDPAPQAGSLASMYDVADELPAAPAPKPAAKPVAAAATQAPAAPAAKPAPTKPASLVKRAQEFGYPQSFIDRASVEELSEAVIEVMANRQGQPSRPEPVASAAATAVTPAIPVEPEFDWGEVDEDGVKRKVTDADIYEPMARVIKRQAKELAEIKALLASQAQAQVAQAELSLEQKVDAAFNEHAHILGKGTGHELKGTAYFKRRKAIWDAIQQIPPERRRTMTVQQAVAEALAELYGDVAAAAAPKAGARVAEWNAGAVAAPTQRKGPAEATGRQKAIDSVAERLKEQSGAGEFGADTTLDEFLD